MRVLHAHIWLHNIHVYNKKNVRNKSLYFIGWLHVVMFSALFKAGFKAKWLLNYDFILNAQLFQKILS